MILPCLDKQRGIVPEDSEPELLDILRSERDRMTQRIDFLTRDRDSIDTCIRAVDDALTRGADLPAA